MGLGSCAGRKDRGGEGQGMVPVLSPGPERVVRAGQGAPRCLHVAEQVWSLLQLSLGIHPGDRPVSEVT